MKLTQTQKIALRHTLWNNGILSFLLWPQQEEIYTVVKELPPHVQKIVFLISRQFGKSVLTCLLALEDCLQNPGVVVMIVGPDLKQTKAIVAPRIGMLKAKGDCPKDLITYLKSDATFYFKNGSEIRLGGFDKNALKERGKTIYKIYLEEIAFSNPDRYHDFIRSDLGPALLHSKNAQIYFVTTPPKFPDHPFLTDTVPDAESTESLFIYTIDDNKALTEEQKEKALREAGGKDSVDAQREYYCRVQRDPSIICVPEFDEDRHVRDFKLPKYYYCWIGGDTGGTRDYTVLLMMAYDFERAKILVCDELAFTSQVGSQEVVHRAKGLEIRYNPVSYRRVDCPGQIQSDWSLDYNYWVSPPRKTKFEEAINFCRTQFTEDRVEIHPRCRFLIRSLRSQQFNDQKTDFLRTKALGHGDGIMALVYGMRHPDKNNPVPKAKERFNLEKTYVGESELVGSEDEIHGIEQEIPLTG